MTSSRDPAPEPVAVAINMSDVLRGMARRKLLVLGLGLLAFALGLGLVGRLKPVYSTEAQILVQNLETPFDRAQTEDNQRGDAVDDRIVASQIAVVQSRDLGRRVIAALKLENDPEFNALLSPMRATARLKLALGFGEDPRLQSPEQRALARYGEALSVYQQPNSNVIAIKYASHAPATAAAVANMLAETYLTWTRESQSQPTERARDWLSRQIDELRIKVAQSEAKVENFRAEAGLLQGTSSTLGTQEISELNTQITVARTASYEARARADSIRELLKSSGSVEASSDVLASAAVQRLKEQRGEAARRVAELSAVYLPNHPRMIAAQNELANVDRQLRAEALKVVASLEEQARVAEARERSLRASLAELKAQETTANLDDVKLKALERDAAADRALLESLLGRFAEASTRQDEATQPGLARIIQTAAVPTSPSFPKPGPMVLLMTMAGLSFGLGLAFLLELMAAAQRLGQPQATGTAATVAQPGAKAVLLPEMPMAPAPPVPEPPAMPWQPQATQPVLEHLATLPGLGDAGRAAEVIASSQVVASAQQIAGWALGARRDSGVRRIGVVASGDLAAETALAALALARALAAAGKKVVLIDLSGAGPTLQELCGASPGPGISDLVTGAAAFTKIFGRDSGSAVHLLRYGLDHSPEAAALIAERSVSLLAALAQSYDFVIADLGAAQAKLPGLLYKCEAALLLAPAGQSDMASNSVQALLSTGLRAARHVLVSQAAGALGSPSLRLRSA